MTIMTQTMISTTAGAKAPFIAMMSTIIMHQDHSAFVRKCTISYSIHAVQESNYLMPVHVSSCRA